MTEGTAYIIGGGGHAHVIASFLDRPVCYVVPEASGPDEMTQQAFFEDIARYRSSPIYIGIGNNAVRRQMFDRLKRLDAQVATCIAPNAWLAPDAEIGEGAVICAGAVIGARASIGENTIINTLSSVDHDCVIGRDTQITAGVTLAGTVRVGENCFFGIKSAVIPGLTIGRDVQVMAGSLIAKSLPDAVLVGGNPARTLRSLADQEAEEPAPPAAAAA